MSNSFKKFVTGIATVAMAVSMVFVGAPVADAATAGEVYKTTDGTVWFITSNMQRRPFTSYGAFLSYGFLSQSQIKEADASVTGLTAGALIAPQDGRIFCASATKDSDVAGECALITGGKKARFTSSNVFTGQGYSFARAYSGDSSFLMNTASNIDNSSAQHLPGTLINNAGTIQLVVTGGLWGVPSLDVFNSWGWSFADTVPANSADTLLSQTGVIPGRVAGQLVPTSTVAPTPTPGSCDPLDGTAGDATTSLLSTYAGEDVGEGQEDAPVLAFEIEADDDSDIEITSIKVELEQTNAADSDKIEDYVSEVSVWLNGEMVGSADADEFTEESDRYSKSISLDCAIVRSGDTEDFSVAITALDQLDSGDIDSDVWDVELDSIRFEDGDGVTTTDSITADTIDQAFDFDTFATANSVELNVALNDDDDAINEARVIDIDDTDDTDNVELLSFTLEAEGDSDINITEIPVLLTSVEATGNDPDDIITGVTLWLEGDEIASETLLTTDADDSSEVVTFDDLDIDIDSGEIANLMVKADIQDTAAAVDNGDTISADLDATRVDLIEAEDQSGEDLLAADLTGTADGEAHAVYDEGIMVEFVSATAVRTFTADEATEDDQGTYKITFDVTAFDGDMYLDRSSETDNGSSAAGEGVVHDETSTAGTPVLSSTLLESNTTDTNDTVNLFQVEENDTRRFTLTVVLAADSTPTDGSHSVAIESINWDDDAADTTPDNFYIFNLNDYKTDALFLNGIL